MNQKRTRFIALEEPFTCENCHKEVTLLGRGYRNHCPFCLYSLHVDEEVPGDRKSVCRGLMTPVGLEKGNRKGYLGYSVIHQCEKCGKTMKNLLAEDDRWEIMLE